MKHVLLFGFLIFLIFRNSISYSQTVYYKYDNSGNRTEKTIYLPQQKSAFITGNKVKEELKEFKDETFSNLSVKIYPNPTKGIIQLEIQDESENSEIIRLIVTESNGRKIIDKVKESYLTQIDLSQYSRGLYLLSIVKGKQVSKWKIIKN